MYLLTNLLEIIAKHRISEKYLKINNILLFNGIDEP